MWRTVTESLVYVWCAWIQQDCRQDMRLSFSTPLEKLFSGGRTCSRSRVYMVRWKVCMLCTQMYIIPTHNSWRTVSCSTLWTQNFWLTWCTQIDTPWWAHISSMKYRACILCVCTLICRPLKGPLSCITPHQFLMGSVYQQPVSVQVAKRWACL